MVGERMKLAQQDWMSCQLTCKVTESPQYSLHLSDLTESHNIQKLMATKPNNKIADIASTCCDSSHMPSRPQYTLDLEENFQTVKTIEMARDGVTHSAIQAPVHKKGMPMRMPTMLRDIKNAEGLSDSSKGNNFKKVKVFHKEVDRKQVYQRTTPFFVGEDSTSQQEVKTMHKDIDYVTKIDLQCSGAGHFEYHISDLQGRFIDYLQRCLDIFENLNTVKVTFNSFDISSGVLQDILLLLRSAEGIHALEVNVNYVTNATPRDFAGMLDLITHFGHKNTCRDFSLQLSGWQFTDGFDFAPMFEAFQAVIAESEQGLLFHHFRLELSAFSITEKHAEQFLRTVALDRPVLEDVILRRWPDKNGEIKEFRLQELTPENQEKCRMLLDKFLDKYIDKDFDTMNEDSMSQEYWKLSGRRLADLVRDSRVELFQRQMAKIVHALLARMPHVEQFTLDMRHWSSLLHMDDLKKKLESKPSPTRKDFSIAELKRLHRTRQSDVAGNRLVKVIYMM